VSILLAAFAIQYKLLDKNNNNSVSAERLFTANELQSFTQDELYLAILGRH